MPWGNRMGPLGYGPMSGRGLGFCRGYAAPGYLKGWPGGWRGYGYRRSYPPYYDYREGEAIYDKRYFEERKKMLEDELNMVEDELKRVKEKVSNINNQENT